jgi:hypothetical protein
MQSVCVLWKRGGLGHRVALGRLYIALFDSVMTPLCVDEKWQMCAIVVIGYLHMCTAYVPYDMGLRAFVGAWVGLCTQDAPCNIGYARVCASALEPSYNAQPNRPVQQRLNLLLQRNILVNQ